MEGELVDDASPNESGHVESGQCLRWPEFLSLLLPLLFNLVILINLNQKERNGVYRLRRGKEEETVQFVNNFELGRNEGSLAGRRCHEEPSFRIAQILNTYPRR